jgi:chorismate dehydratase
MNDQFGFSVVISYQAKVVFLEVVKTESIHILNKGRKNKTEMEKIRISAVKYANTAPFIWGLNRSEIARIATIETDHPAVCARKLMEGSADIGLIPVAAIPRVPGSRIISDYCIGTNGNVRTVMLLSNCPFDQLTVINLDYRSVSSVTLVKVLAKHFWKKDFKWKDTSEKTDFFNIECHESVVLIGDQCFESESKFTYGIDLALEWKKFTGLPFVFACWVANRDIDSEFLQLFNNALKDGVENIQAVVRDNGDTGIIKNEDLFGYLTKNIDFLLDEKKREAMYLFLKYSEKL